MCRSLKPNETARNDTRGSFPTKNQLAICFLYTYKLKFIIIKIKKTGDKTPAFLLAIVFSDPVLHFRLTDKIQTFAAAYLEV